MTVKHILCVDPYQKMIYDLKFKEQHVFDL